MYIYIYIYIYISADPSLAGGDVSSIPIYQYYTIIQFAKLPNYPICQIAKLPNCQIG